MHPDLKRFVTWRRLQRENKKKLAEKPVEENIPRHLRVEYYAKVNPPPVSETGSSNAWSMVMPADKDYPIHPKSKTSTRPTKRTQQNFPTGEGAKMEQEVPPEALNEIQELESRLAALAMCMDCLRSGGE